MTPTGDYSPIPENTFFDLGGYTGFKTREWERYLSREIRRKHPFYFVRQFFTRNKNRWQQNDCIYESLKKYLLFEFGILLPVNTIFQVFNRDGAGLLPDEILTAISAVIEPLGLVIDNVLAVEPRLRRALGRPEKMVDVEDAALFENRAGICMIQIKPGYSHAFFWDRMRTSKFSNEQFRLALTIRRQKPLQSPPVYSVLAGLLSYQEMADQCCAANPQDRILAAVAGQIHELVHFASSPDSMRAPDFGSLIDQKWERLLTSIQTDLRKTLSKEKLSQLLDAGQALRTLFQEAL